MSRPIARTIALTCTLAAITVASPAHGLSLSDPTEVPEEVTLWFQANSTTLLDEMDRSGTLGMPIPHHFLDTTSMSLLEMYPDSYGALYRGDNYCAPVNNQPDTPPEALADEYLCASVTVSDTGVATQANPEPELLTIDRTATGYTKQPAQLINYHGALLTDDWDDMAIHGLNEKALALLGTPKVPSHTFGTWLLSVGQLPLEAPEHVIDWFTNQAPELINQTYAGSTGMELNGTNTIEIAQVIPLAFETPPQLNELTGEPNPWLTLSDTPTWEPGVHTYCAQLIIDSTLSNSYQCARSLGSQQRPTLELAYLFELDYSSPSTTYTAPLILVSASGAPGYYAYRADHTIVALESWAHIYLDGATMSAETYLAKTEYRNAILEELTRIKQDPGSRALVGANSLEVSKHQTYLRDGITKYGHIKLATGIAIGVTTTLLLVWGTHRYRTRTKTGH